MKTAYFLMTFVLALGVIGGINANDPVRAGDVLTFYVNTFNADPSEIDDVQVKVLIYDLGLFYSSNNFDVRHHEPHSNRVSIPIPRHVQPGHYLARVSASNDDFRSTQHRIVTIV